MKVTFETKLEKFAANGDKTGWTYFVIPKSLAEKIKPGTRRSFRVKGKIDAHPLKFVAMIPYGQGDFIIAVNGEMRKGIGKRAGAKIKVVLEEDRSDFIISPLLVDCLTEVPAALNFFQSLSPSHQRYFSNWIESAKTDFTREKRIAMSVSALEKGMGYPEMIRASKKD